MNKSQIDILNEQVYNLFDQYFTVQLFATHDIRFWSWKWTYNLFETSKSSWKKMIESNFSHLFNNWMKNFVDYLKHVFNNLQNEIKRFFVVPRRLSYSHSYFFSFDRWEILVHNDNNDIFINFCELKILPAYEY